MYAGDEHYDDDVTSGPILENDFYDYGTDDDDDTPDDDGSDDYDTDYDDGYYSE